MEIRGISIEGVFISQRQVNCSGSFKELSVGDKVVVVRGAGKFIGQSGEVTKKRGLGRLSVKLENGRVLSFAIYCLEKKTR